MPPPRSMPFEIQTCSFSAASIPTICVGFSPFVFFSGGTIGRLYLNTAQLQRCHSRGLTQIFKATQVEHKKACLTRNPYVKAAALDINPRNTSPCKIIPSTIVSKQYGDSAPRGYNMPTSKVSSASLFSSSFSSKARRFLRWIDTWG